jgi:hypothetical protein
VTSRDFLIVQFVAAFGCATRDVLQKRFFDECTEAANAVVKVTSRLRSAHYLEKHRLYGKRCYYKTGYRAAQLGLRWAKEPYGATALPRLYAAMAYLNRGGVSRTKLDRTELQRLFPTLRVHGEVTYFWESEKLGAVLTDLGGTEFYLAHKLRTFHEQRFQVPSFRDLLERDQFHLVVVVPTKERAATLLRCLENDPVPLRIVLADMQDLIHLTTRVDHDKA